MSRSRPGERLGSSSARVIVLGHIVRGPVGGMAWHHLQYVLGLARLGHDVFFVEDSQDYASCYDPSRGEIGVDPAYGLRFAAKAFEFVGLAERWAYYDAHTATWLGPGAGEVKEVCATADLLLNMSGKNPMRPWFAEIPHRALIDTDPAFTQIRHLKDERALEAARQHTAFSTFGENIAAGTARVPDDGLPWKPTRQPVVLDAWVASAPPIGGRLTTVMLWDSYRACTFAGTTYGMKSMSFGPYTNLPTRIGRVFDLAVGSPGVPKSELRAAGWNLLNPLDVSRTPQDYRQFIQRSKAEFSVAKHGYVASHSGWFSERSAAYLASGRPVVVQDTGFSTWLQADGGVLGFHTPDEAVARIADLNARYSHHCAQARAVAEAYFDSSSVLTRLLEDCCSARVASRERR